MKCDHCDKPATHQTAIWFLCGDCLQEWKDGMKAEREAAEAYDYEIVNRKGR